MYQLFGGDEQKSIIYVQPNLKVLYQSYLLINHSRQLKTNLKFHSSWYGSNLFTSLGYKILKGIT